MKKLPWLCLLTMILLSSCRGKEFDIEFDLDPKIEDSYRLLYYASDKKGGRWIETAAPIHQGKYSARYVTINPTIVYIFRSNGNLPETFLYAERGDKLTVTGESSNPVEWKMTGNEVTDLLSEWQDANSRVLTQHETKDINKAVASYVEKNPKSKIDPLLLLLRFNREADPEEFLRLWNSMAEKQRKSPLVNLIASPDMLSLSTLDFDDKGNVTLLPGKEVFPRLKVRTSGKKSETLRPVAKGRKASLVWFWHISDPMRTEIVDTLRAFSRAHRQDSVRLLLADVCLDGASLRWRNIVNADTLPGFTRGWWAEGTSNREAMRLGISAYRTFVIFGPKGEVRYKGSDLSEALTRLRKEL